VLKYNISAKVLEMYPGYVRGVVIGEGLRNGLEEQPELVTLLREAEDRVMVRADLENIAEHPRIGSWRAAYGKFGVRPSKFFSSIEALARRVRKGGQLPYINDLAAIGNIYSLRHLAPVGGHDVGDVQHDLWLTLAEGDELFTPFGTDEVEKPEPGEVVYLDGKTVLCRRWTWRQAEATKLVAESHHVAINVDGLPPVTFAEVQDICEEMAERVSRFCGGRTICRYLMEGSPAIDLKV